VKCPVSLISRSHDLAGRQFQVEDRIAPLVVATEAVWPIAETQSPVQVLVRDHGAACQRCSPAHALDLQNQVLKAHRVVPVHGALELQRKNALQILAAIWAGGTFRTSKQVVSYLGLNPQEHSSGGKQRLGAISKQGNPMMRSLLVEAGHTAARFDPALKRMYQRLKFRRGASVAKVAVARKLAVRMYWMLRSTADYAQLVRMQGSPWATLVEDSPSLG
jgi:Transposase IS116/IS110/IS902 family